MKKSLLHKAADRVWYWWEENKAVDEEFEYGRAQKVGAFADFVDELSEDEESFLGIAGLDNHYHGYVARALYKIIQKGIDDFLGNPVEKLLAGIRGVKQ